MEGPRVPDANHRVAAMGRQLCDLAQELQQHLEREIPRWLRVLVTVEDAHQDACLRATRDGEARADGQAWSEAALRQRVDGALADALRRERRMKRGGVARRVSLRHPAIVAKLTGDSENPLQVLIREEEEEIVREAVADLAEPEREVIRMRYLDEVPLAEAARRLNLSRAAANRRRDQGVRELRGRLADWA